MFYIPYVYSSHHNVFAIVAFLCQCEYLRECGGQFNKWCVSPNICTLFFPFTSNKSERSYASESLGASVGASAPLSFSTGGVKED